MLVEGDTAKAPAIWLYREEPDWIGLLTGLPLASAICVISNTPIVALACVRHSPLFWPCPAKNAGVASAFGAVTEKLNENAATSVPLNVPEGVPETSA